VTRDTGKDSRTPIRCAIYTRKSTEEGLEQEFNSLDAQRESAEAFITSMKHEGWTCLPEHYDDGGFTGGNMDRPALKRLIADIEAKRVDCVVVYKVDRLSRSLMDFSRLMEVFDRQGISFVSVTQQFNTTHSMGRLTLNILLSFAQFEREIISERTRDKIAATRRKGKWSGGAPVLGYDVVNGKLVVNEEEADRVREIFRLYMELGSLQKVVHELDGRDWRTKAWRTKSGSDRGGQRFSRPLLRHLLINVLYMGQVRYKAEVHPGEQEGIVDPKLFEQVQRQLESGKLIPGHRGIPRNPQSLLKGLIRCVPCGCRMVPSHTRKQGRNYRYYVCTRAQKRGWHTCPSKSLPAGEIERYVSEQLAGLEQDPQLVAATLAHARNRAQSRRSRLDQERRQLETQCERETAELRDLLGSSEQTSERVVERTAFLQESITRTEQRQREIDSEVRRLRQEFLQHEGETELPQSWEEIWGVLSSRERYELLHLLIERIDYDGRTGEIEIFFHETGIPALEQATKSQDQGQVA